jgi:hypothetical protein
MEGMLYACSEKIWYWYMLICCNFVLFLFADLRRKVVDMKQAFQPHKFQSLDLHQSQWEILEHINMKMTLTLVYIATTNVLKLHSAGLFTFERTFRFRNVFNVRFNICNPRFYFFIALFLNDLERTTWRGRTGKMLFFLI